MYLGNKRLRKESQKVDLDQKQINEFIKCREDIIYFAENYFYIISLDKGREKIKLWDFQKRMLKALVNPPNDKRHLIFLSSRQIGKALDIETDIITPNGFVKLKDINVGDKIYGFDGKPVNVSYITEIMYDHDVYQIEFSNGEKINADAEHLWKINNGKIVNTKEMIGIQNRLQNYKKPTRCYIEYIKNPLEFSNKELKIHPYVLGLYIGDGSKYDGRIVCSCEDYEKYQQKIKSCGYEISEFKRDKRSENTGYFFIKGLYRQLINEEILHNKFIPDEYIFNSYENRIELLKGLMDTDGYCNPKGSCLFYNTNYDIIEKVKVLLSTLAIKYHQKIKKTDFKDCYVLTFNNAKFDVFNLNRKCVRLKKQKNHKKSGRIYIKNIKKIDSVPVRCLQVDNEDHLFLCGKSLIPTHNTTINTIFFTWYALFHKDKTIAILAHKEKAAMDILKRIKFAYEQLPLWMQQGIRDGGWNKKEVLLENGVTIFASSTSSNACKSYAVNLLYLDEFAFVPDSIADDFMSSVYPTIASGKTSRIIIVSCVSDDTFVFTDNGIKQVKDFVKYNEKNAYEVLDYNVLGKEKLNCGNIMVNNGYVNTKIIKTTSSELECSLNHKFWACKNGKYGWYKSSELTTDDYISIQYGMNMWGNDDDVDWQPKISNHHKNIFECKKITSDVAYFLGLFIAEGCGHLRYRNNKKFYSGITITCGDDISKILDSNKIKYYSKDCLHYEISSMSLIDFMEYLGFDLTKKANEKIIPKRLMQMSKKNMKALIQGIFDGDVYSRNDKGYIGIGLSSKELIKQIRMILLNFGILTDYQEVLTKPTKKVKVDSMQYRISCNGYFSKKFYKEIGFRFERKKLKEQFIREGKRSGACDVIPYSVDFLRKKFKHHKNIKLFSGCHKNNIHFSRKFVLENKNDLMKYGDDECINWIDDNVNENIKWEKISEIKDSKNEVFDFSLKEIKNDKWCHSIVYNGIIAHNTPNGMNHFYNIWKNAISNKNNYFPVKIKWNEVPGRDDNFKKDTIADIGLVKWNQEFACQKGNSLINIRLITEKTVKSVKILDLFDCENYK